MKVASQHVVLKLFICTCVYICMYMYIYVYIYVYIYAHTCAYICMYALYIHVSYLCTDNCIIQLSLELIFSSSS